MEQEPFTLDRGDLKVPFELLVTRVTPTAKPQPKQTIPCQQLPKPDRRRMLTKNSTKPPYILSSEQARVKSSF